MGCLICGTELAAKEGICTPCAASHIAEEWFSDKEGYFRVRKSAELVSVLDEDRFRMTLGGESPDERIARLPETQEGYAVARRLMKEVMAEFREGGAVMLPRYGSISRTLAKLERYDELYPEDRDREICDALASMYADALKNFTLPLAPAGFIEEKKSALRETADYWRRRAGDAGKDAGAGDVSSSGGADRRASAENAQGTEHPLAANADALRARIRFMEDQIASLRRIVPAGALAGYDADAMTLTAADRIRDLREKIGQIEEKMVRLRPVAESANPVPPGPAPVAETHEELDDRDAYAMSHGHGLMKKRIAVSMLSGEFRDAFDQSLEILRDGKADEDDFATATLLALKMNDQERLERIGELAAESGVAGWERLGRAIFTWKDGKWGSAVQLADEDIEQTGSSAAYLLKMNICRQYGLTDRADELEEQRRKVHGLASGAEFLSKAYLQMDMWGAALQCLEVLPEDDWTDSTWCVRAMAMERKGAADDAINAYDRSLMLNGRNASSIVGKAMLLSADGRRAEAEELLKSADDLWPPVARLRASILSAMGKEEEALELLKEASREDGGDEKIARAGASLSAQLGKRKDRKYFTSLLSARGAAQ